MARWPRGGDEAGDSVRPCTIEGPTTSSQDIGVTSHGRTVPRRITPARQPLLCSQGRRRREQRRTRTAGVVNVEHREGRDRGRGHPPRRQHASPEAWAGRSRPPVHPGGRWNEAATIAEVAESTGRDGPGGDVFDDELRSVGLQGGRQRPYLHHNAAYAQRGRGPPVARRARCLEFDIGPIPRQPDPARSARPTPPGLCLPARRRRTVGGLTTGLLLLIAGNRRMLVEPHGPRSPTIEPARPQPPAAGTAPAGQVLADDRASGGGRSPTGPPDRWWS